MHSFCFDFRPAELHFHEINRRRMRRRNPSPSREVSPVPSYFSEPVSSRKRKVNVEMIWAVSHVDKDTLLVATCS